MSEAKVAFARRLNEAFDRLGIPAKQRGRFTALARLFGVSAVAARDWCEGKSYPGVDKLLVIMDTVRCDADWLLFGRPGSAVAVAEAPGDAAEARPPEPRADPEGTWLAIGSDAMAPTLLPGDQVKLVAMSGDALADGLYAVGTERRPAAGAPGPGDAGAGGTLSIRRLQCRLDGSVALTCDNPLYRDSRCCLDCGGGRLQGLAPGDPEVRLLGRVTELRRPLR